MADTPVSTREPLMCDQAELEAMKHVHVHLRGSRSIGWSAATAGETRAWAKGFSFSGPSLLAGRALAENSAGLLVAFEGAREGEDPGSAIREHNGSFALVAVSTSLALAVVDRIRSLPLFYGQHNSEIYISDDADWVREQVHDEAMDETAVTEFLLTGYVTGQETLFPNVRQLQAGECLVVRAGTVGIQVSTQRYYRWVHSDYFTCPVAELHERLDQVLLQAFERLLGSTTGRTIAVPLSGGRDSRLVAAMLKKLGRKDVLCFSYGAPGNWESEVSKKVADTLGYPWVFVPSSPSWWRERLRTPEREEFFRYAGGLSSATGLQDWPAVWELKKSGRIPDDAVLVPGHTGDVISGGHIPWGLAQRERVSKTDVVEQILDRHYILWDWSRRRPALGPIFNKRVLHSFGELATEGSEAAASIFESWEWQERQAKFIVNMCRAYEFWGFDWRVPLWDNAMLEFWARVPLPLRLGKRLYNACLDRGIFTEFGIRQERFANLYSRQSAFARTTWRILPFTHPFWGLASYSELVAAYRVYRQHFGYSLPPLYGDIVNTYVSAWTVRTLGGPAALESSGGRLASVLRVLELASLIVRGGLRKAANFCRRHAHREHSA